MNPKLPQTALSLLTLVLFANHASGAIIYQDLHLVPQYAKIHGLLMGIAFVIVLPFGAVLIRVLKLEGNVWIHAACQIVGWVLMIAGLALGIRLGTILDLLHSNPHTILGTVVVALLLAQPFIGFIQHRRFLAKRKRGVWSHFHTWYGRALILLGIINGGLGLRLADNTKAGTIAYGVVGGLVGAIYCALIAVFEFRNWRQHDKTRSEAGADERSKSENP